MGKSGGASRGTATTVAERTRRAGDLTPRVPAAAPDRLQAVLAQVEPKMARRRAEVGLVLDANGDVLNRYQGTDDNRLLLHIADNFSEIAHQYGATFTHNHPNNSALSDRDIRLLYESGWREIRAVTDRYVYSLVNPEVGHGYKVEWGAQRWEDMRRETELNRMYLAQQLQLYQLRHPGESSAAYQRYLQSDGQHKHLQYLAKEYGLIYRRVPRRK